MKFFMHLWLNRGCRVIGNILKNSGAIFALQGVKEEIDNIIAELKRKGFDEPKGFSVLKGYVDDRMNDFRSDE